MMINVLVKTGLANNLTAAGPFTVFALTDDGFKELKSKAPAWYNYFIPNPIPVLLDFIVKGLVKPSNIRPGMSAMSQGGKIYFDSVDNGKVNIFYDKFKCFMCVLCFTYIFLSKTMAVNGSRIIDYMQASNGIVYTVTNQIVEDIFSMLPYLPASPGEELSIMIKLLQISGVSKMIDHRKHLNSIIYNQ